MQLRTLLFVSFVVACALAQFDDPSVSVKKLRGIDKIGIGFDLVTMQLKMSPIELTWLGKYFTSPYDDKDYEIPMEIDSISTPDTFVNRTTTVSLVSRTSALKLYAHRLKMFNRYYLLLTIGCTT